jgi:curli biogenesis system outer membrane secretion channel CsgG
MIGKSVTAIVLGIMLAGVAAAQSTAKSPAGTNGKIRMAVVEFTAGPNASEMTAEVKRQLQASIAFELFSTKKFDVVDVRNTRSATQASLTAINGDGTTAAAKAGKGLGVSLILIGTVTEYIGKDGAGNGRVRMNVRVVEVATGKVKYSGEISQKSTSAMRSGGAEEMKLKVLKPAIETMTGEIVDAF